MIQYYNVHLSFFGSSLLLVMVVVVCIESGRTCSSLNIGFRCRSGRKPNRWIHLQVCYIYVSRNYARTYTVSMKVQQGQLSRLLCALCCCSLRTGPCISSSFLRAYNTHRHAQRSQKLRRTKMESRVCLMVLLSMCACMD